MYHLPCQICHRLVLGDPTVPVEGAVDAGRVRTTYKTGHDRETGKG